MLYTKFVEKIKTHFIFNIFFFFEYFDVREIMPKNMMATEGPQYGAYALHAGKARLHSRTIMYTRPCIHTRTHARTNRPISNNYFFSTATMIRERPSVLRHTYIACLVCSEKYCELKLWRITNCTGFCPVGPALLP
jgi:hypothetical protein